MDAVGVGSHIIVYDLLHGILGEAFCLMLRLLPSFWGYFIVIAVITEQFRALYNVDVFDIIYILLYAYEIRHYLCTVLFNTFNKIFKIKCFMYVCR